MLYLFLQRRPSFVCLCRAISVGQNACCHRYAAAFSFCIHLWNHQPAGGTVETTDIYEKEYIAPNERNSSFVKGPETRLSLAGVYGRRLQKRQRTKPATAAVRAAGTKQQISRLQAIMYADATISALTAGICSLPDKTETKLKNLFSVVNSNLPNATSLSDILKKHGHNASFIQNADIAFAGTDKFARRHGFDFVAGNDEPLKKYPDIASGAKENDRGIKDSVLYDTVRREILHLAEGKNPF